MRAGTCLMSIGLMVLLLGMNSGEAWAGKKIGIFMFSEETRYLEATRGFKDALTAAGFDKNKVAYFVENAGGNKARAVEVVKRLSAQKLDLILSLGTSATVPLSREIKDVPIVFSVVYDPVEAGIATSWKSSGNNTTGNSPLIPMAKLMDHLQQLVPVKRLAVLYTPGEKNSETQLRDLLKIQDKYQIRMIPVRLSSKEEVNELLPEVLRTTDAMYITGSNLVNSQVSTIVDLATKAKVITITHLEDLVTKGVLLGVCADSYELGRQAGGKAVKILKGAKPAAIPIDPATKITVLLNMKTVKKGSYSIPVEFMKSVTRKIE